jgi:hypothetical protein
MNDKMIKISSIKNQLLAETAKKYLNCVCALRSINWKYPEYLALKYLVLFDPGMYTIQQQKIDPQLYISCSFKDVAGISNSKCVEEVQESISSALVEYLTTTNTPFVTEKLHRLLLKLPDIKLIGLYIKQLLILIDTEAYNSTLLEGTLLAEMLYGPSNLTS